MRGECLESVDRGHPNPDLNVPILRKIPAALSSDREKVLCKLITEDESWLYQRRRRVATKPPRPSSARAPGAGVIDTLP